MHGVFCHHMPTNEFAKDVLTGAKLSFVEPN